MKKTLLFLKKKYSYIYIYIYMKKNKANVRRSPKSSNTQGLTDGGLAGLFWSYVWTFIGFGFVIFSLGEMASM